MLLMERTIFYRCRRSHISRPTITETATPTSAPPIAKELAPISVIPATARPQTRETATILTEFILYAIFEKKEEVRDTQFSIHELVDQSGSSPNLYPQLLL